MLNNYLISLIRTLVPIGIGAVAGWLAVHYGLHVTGPAQSGLTAVATAVISGLYYAAVRAAETRWPVLSILLGHPSQPVYTVPGATPLPLPVHPAAPQAPPDPRADPLTGCLPVTPQQPPGKMGTGR